MKYLIAFLLIINVSFAQNYIEKAIPKVTPTKQGDNDYPLNLNKIGIKLPNTKDETLKNLLSDSRTIFYKFPQSFQFFQPSSKVEHKNLTLGTTYLTTTKEIFGIYFSTYLPEYNANTFFPWETTVGLNHALATGNSPYGAINFINLPYLKPIVVINERPVKWIFPVGTTVAEVLYVNYNNDKFIFEIRTRIKTLETWEPNVYRPISNRKELEEYIGPINPSKKYLFLRNPQEDEVFKAEGFVERIPDLTPEKTKELFSLYFKNVTNEIWSTISNVPCSDQTFSLFPKDYTLGLINVDSDSCSACHRQTQISVNRLIPKEPLIYNNPEKVGNIRGSDGVFTWTPFDISAISKDPSETKVISLRKHDTDNNIVILYDRLMHTEYKLTPYVQRSLADYELPKETSVLNELNTIDKNLANLSAPDQRLVETQKLCPVCQNKLGEKGVPLKTIINGQEKFVCEQKCKETLK